MGQTQSRRKQQTNTSTANKHAVTMQASEATASTMTSTRAGEEFVLKKRRPGCTGMFWRQDPSPGAVRMASNSNWPRDGAKLRGTVATVKGEKWLLVTHVQQSGSGEWKRAPQGVAMPFEYNNHYYLE